MRCGPRPGSTPARPLRHEHLHRNANFPLLRKIPLLNQSIATLEQALLGIHVEWPGLAPRPGVPQTTPPYAGSFASIDEALRPAGTSTLAEFPPLLHPVRFPAARSRRHMRLQERNQ